jgi:Domain of unknown function (DUF4082)
MSPVSWSFTTAAAVSGSSVSLWAPTDVPKNASESDTSAVELGVKFTSDVDGIVTGVRFYKGNASKGTHVGSLWDSSGQKLATATFTNETDSGWQQVTFAKPVTIQPDTVYVASYHTNRGHYVDDNYFTSRVDNGPLHALADGESGPNGVYRYGTTSRFPRTGNAKTNYWVDVVFVPST